MSCGREDSRRWRRALNRALGLHTFDDKLIARLERAARVAVLTGAGISAESGLPTFRGPGGWWRNQRAEDLATPEAFERNPHLVWEWYQHRREQVAQHRPNAGHAALAELAGHVQQFTLITQCVDRYHQQAGAREVIELHGNLIESRCLQCGVPAEGATEVWRAGLPYCGCGGLRRPAVVWFGEELPAAALRRAFRAAEECTLFFAIGTSALVYPAAQLPHVARAAGAAVVEINPERTPLTPQAQWFLQGPAGEILPALLVALAGAAS